MMKKKNAVIYLIVLVLIMCGLGYMAVFGVGADKSGAASSIDLGLDLAGGVSITYQVVGEEEPSKEDMADTIYKLQMRVDNYSTEAQVYQEGSDRINIEIPGVSDANAILEELGKPGSLAFYDKDGNEVSYVPPRFYYSYDFDIVIHVNHPYFDEINFRLNPSSIETNPNNAVTSVMKPKPIDNVDYREYNQMANEIKRILTTARQQAREEAAAAPKTAVICACCGATTIPDAAGRCEFCGGAAQG